MTLVLDASVAAAWLLPDESSDLADRVIARLGAEKAVVPPIFWLEVANILQVSTKRGRIDSAARDASLHDLLALALGEDLDGQRARLIDIAGLAAQFDLTAYDAAYLELAVREDATLVTLDDRLAAAGRSCGLAVVAR